MNTYANGKPQNIYDGIELNGKIVDYVIGFTCTNNIPVMLSNQGLVTTYGEYQNDITKNDIKEMITVRHEYIKTHKKCMYSELQKKIIIGLIKNYKQI